MNVFSLINGNLAQFNYLTFLPLDSINEAVQAHMLKIEGGWQCVTCGWEAKNKMRMFEHVEARHVETDGYSCPICSKFCPTIKSLKNHKFTYHRNAGPLKF